ncbi:MAG: hypothetical protein JEY99_21045 [Spirochaetales bacterium]|nr:hypothetical protein [Spirochaetales bacterium]
MKKGLKMTVSVFIFLIILLAAGAETITYPGDYSSGDLIGAAGMNARFSLVYSLLNGHLDSDNLADDAVGSSEIADDAVGTSEIADNAVSSSEIADDAVDSSNLASDADSLTEVSGGMMLITGGKIGIGTSSPNTKLEISSGGSGSQLDYTGQLSLSGWSGQLDLVDTDAGFKDYALRVTGNRFSIISSPWNYDHFVLYDDKLGLGTETPLVKLHIIGGTDAALGSGGYIQTGASASPNIVMDDNEIQARNNGVASTLNIQNEGGGITIHQAVSGTEIIITDSGSIGFGKSPAYTVDVFGAINCNGGFYNSGTWVADYVFQDDYSIPSIEEHGESMWINKHLPNVSGKDALGDEPYNMSERREQILSELEIAHIYIEQLNETIMNLEERITDLEKFF